MSDTPAAVTWAYGAAGILGFATQMIVGIQGRLLPLHAWYRALEHHDGVLPNRSVHRRIEPRLALAVFLFWLAGLPVLMAGLIDQRPRGATVGAAALLLATLFNASYGVLIVRRA
jgi:hypothetical protein